MYTSISRKSLYRGMTIIYYGDLSFPTIVAIIDNVSSSHLLGLKIPLDSFMSIDLLRMPLSRKSHTRLPKSSSLSPFSQIKSSSHSKTHPSKPRV